MIYLTIYFPCCQNSRYFYQGGWKTQKIKEVYFLLIVVSSFHLFHIFTILVQIHVIKYMNKRFGSYKKILGFYSIIALVLISIKIRSIFSFSFQASTKNDFHFD